MSLRIVEFFGYAPDDQSATAVAARRNKHCPFLEANCTKTLSDGLISGACTLQPATSGPVICCPNRLYAEDYRILSDVATSAFGEGTRLIPAQEAARARHDGRNVAVFGKRWGKELRLPQKGGRGAYFVDWILALIDADGSLGDFVAVEVQAIDTTGNYRKERDAYLRNRAFTGSSKAGLNWENVSKRILPQIIYKGHVLRREPLCRRGLFFVCPTPVYNRIQVRLGNALLAYPIQPGSLTFRWYTPGPAVPGGGHRELLFEGQFTTTIDQVAVAFTAPTNLPPAGVYQEAIQAELGRNGG